MRRSWFPLVMFFLLLPAIYGYNQQIKPLFDQPFISDNPLRVGEKLTFKATLFGIPAGWQILQTVDKLVIDGQEVIYVRSTSRTNDFFSRIYFFSDTRESFLNPDTLIPIRYRKKIVEKKFKAEVEVAFDLENGVAIVKDRNNERKVTVPHDIQDELSMLFLIRTRVVEEGESYTFPLLMRNGVQQITVRVQGRKSVKTVLGRVKTLIVTSSNGHKVWLTADERRIPVRIEAKTRLGKVVGKLISAD